ncbi:polysaccharide biosynthesis/export family protein [Phenylobacterium aquaticum]|uniref:polysaccharide biosynthesis/export family protein n=1 Tax=Phenylobacterium aquaticum TaxID=1763816 RepID=UPI001F5CC7F4|nr:polysaccharide biosynthesis/export family protein [Phenylobacterium aquaticum]MCI3132722.1 polysaccharide export protein [Phenylobacterium aquaticum]
MTKWFGLIAACLMFALTLGAAEARAADAPSGGTRAIPEYRLGPGDKVRVTTFGEQSLSGEFFVGASGKISVPLVGELQAAGLTARQFQTSFEEALKDGYLKEPKVSVEILNYRPFYILGEVEKPGTYPYTSDLNVLNAVATAGGFTYRANKKRVFIKRQDSDKEEAYDLGPTTQVAPGDTIRIEERLF